GTLLCAIGFCLLQTVHTFPWLVLLLFLTGLGSSVQHPLCSALVSQAYEEGPRRTVLGTYNFTGDLGKMSLPVAITLLITWFGWRSATFCTGATAGVCAIVIYAALRRIDTVVYAPRVSKDSLSGNGWGIRDKRSFTVLSTIHILDSTARTSLLTYLSFVLLAKGAELPTIGIAVGLTLGGGAAGKFFCAVLAQRYGINRTVITTELVTGGGIAALVFLPLGPALILLPVLGMALNGTSSVLYGTVAELVEAKKRGRAYGLFYTLGIGSGALAPSVYGLLCDRVGVQATLLTTAVVVLLIIPLVNLLHLTDTPQQ
ncbi:MAG TPA: MFS transporter, partial [Oligoflexia bacterium]|nr:MFS transporter [Oligoflexia bacterium]